MEILLAVGVMALCFIGLGLGLVLKRRHNCVQGSCGGEAAKDPNSAIACMTCSGDPKKCPEPAQSAGKSPTAS
jgi:hypothetical protein